MKAIGRHVILEMWGCQNLDSVQTAEQALREMVDALDVNLLDLHVYPFSPVGVTGMAIVGVANGTEIEVAELLKNPVLRKLFDTCRPNSAPAKRVCRSLPVVAA